MKARLKRKRLFSFLLTATLLFSQLPATALAATVDSTYTPGTYKGTATGHNKGDVTVTVALEESNDSVVISDISATGEGETEGLWGKALNILDIIKDNKGTDGLAEKLDNKEFNTITGATVSAKAIVAATESALSKASTEISGNGTASKPYLISNAAQLAAFATAVDGGKTYEGEYVALGADIDLKDIDNWNPIGTENGTTHIFNGTFDGKGHTISNLKIDAPDEDDESYHGLFSILDNEAVVKNLNVIEVSISVTNSGVNKKVHAGGIAGKTQNVATGNSVGTHIDSCSATGSVSVTSTGDALVYAGGITGWSGNSTVITNCWSNVSVSAVTDTKDSMAGGIIGMSGTNVVIANCAAFGDVSAKSPSAVDTKPGGKAGGLAGMMGGKQYNSYATGDITIGNGGNVHTWVGTLDGQITTAGMTKDSDGNLVYPSQGALRDKNYYAEDAKLKVLVYENNGADLSRTYTPETKDRGYSEKTTVDEVMVSTAMKKAAMATESFAATLNGNIKEINTILKAYGITGIELREWEVKNGKVLPIGDVWAPGEIDETIFESGKGTAEDPYIIANETQLKAFAGSLNNNIDYTDTYVALGNDIELKSAEWSPIGGSDYLFNGTFDGKGHSITGMKLGTENKPYALDKENLYIGLFGVLGPKAIVQDVHVDVAFYTTYEVTAYVGGIAGVTQGNKANNAGAIIDGCSVTGTLSLTADKGNQFVGGLVGMQYKGATINSWAQVNASCVVKSGDLAEVGGLAGMNNRGLVANCWSKSNIYGSGSRENGDEGMAAVSPLIACNAGALVNCYGSGNVSTKEHSTYAGMVSGWVTGIGKSYTCWYDLDSTMTLKTGDDKPQVVDPVESIGTKVSSGVNDEGDAYTGGLVDKMTGYNAAGYAAIAGEMNKTFDAFPIDITTYGLKNTALKNWSYENGLVSFGTDNGNVTYVQPDCEKYEPPVLEMKDGVWYGRDDEKTTVVKITVAENTITATEVLQGASEGNAYDAAVEKAKYKATYGDFSHYEAADPSQFAGGSGTATDPYLIANEAQLRYLSSSINADVDWSGKYFKQTADITLNGEWQPIGWAVLGEVNSKKATIGAYPFRGNYDGGNFTINGLKIGSASTPADQYASGLFGLAAGSYKDNSKPTGEEQVVRLKNIHLRNIDINTSARYETLAGGLVGSGENGFYIDNCSVTGKINTETSESFARAGGLAASVLRGSVTNSWADVNINAATDTNHVYAGGLYGLDNRVTTVNCYALGDVTGNSTNNNKVHIGGLTGQAGAIHVNCYAAGNVVSLKTTTDVGILNGRSGGIAIDVNCYYNTEALLKQGNTTVSPAVGIGVNANNKAIVENVVGKTAAELKSSDFAAQLNENKAETNLAAAMKVVADGLAAQSGNLDQQNYYENNALSDWALKGGIVTLTTSAGTSSGGSSSGGGSSSSGGGGKTTKPAETPATVGTIENANASAKAEAASAATNTAAANAAKKDAAINLVTAAGTTVSGENFTEPVQMKVPVDTKNVTNINNMTLAKFNAQTGTLEIVGGSYDAEKAAVVGYVTEAGDYFVVEKDNLKTITLQIANPVAVLNNTKNTLDTAPLLSQDRTMVPLRFIAEAFGADVAWNQKTKTVTITLNDEVLTMKIGQELQGFGAAPIISNNRTMVPISYISKQLDAKVVWVPSTKTVFIAK